MKTLAAACGTAAQTGHFEPEAVAKIREPSVSLFFTTLPRRNKLKSAMRDAYLHSCNVEITPGPSAMHEPRVIREHCLPLATTISSHMLVLPARHWIRPMRLPSQRAHTTRSICKTRCGSDSETRSPSCRATRRSTLAALAALLMQPALTALADLEQVGNP